MFGSKSLDEGTTEHGFLDHPSLPNFLDSDTGHPTTVDIQGHS